MTKWGEIIIWNNVGWKVILYATRIVCRVLSWNTTSELFSLNNDWMRRGNYFKWYELKSGSLGYSIVTFDPSNP